MNRHTYLTDWERPIMEIPRKGQIWKKKDELEEYEFTHFDVSRPVKRPDHPDFTIALTFVAPTNRNRNLACWMWWDQFVNNWEYVRESY